MATATFAASPLDGSYTFQQIGARGPYRVLIALQPSPGSSNNVLEVRHLRRDIYDVSYRINFNGGRLGTPGLELTISHRDAASGEIRSATVVFEPGVGADVASVLAGRQYNLQDLLMEWLGRPGGGGHYYDNDPQTIGKLNLEAKKGTLRVTVKICGFYSPEPQALSALMLALPAKFLQHTN